MAHYTTEASRLHQEEVAAQARLAQLHVMEALPLKPPACTPLCVMAPALGPLPP